MSEDQLNLRGKVAIVTGASRGIGRGIANALGEAGATAYVTGRGSGPADQPGTVERTAAEVERRGGKGIAVQCNHGDVAQIAALFDRVLREQGRLDLLVNNAFSIGDSYGKLFQPFWKLNQSVWDEMIGIGLRAAYVASVHAARAMVEQGSGLIVNISSFGAARYHFNLPYHVGKTGTDRMTRDMGYELRPHGVAAVSFWPGLVLTDSVEAAGGLPDSERRKGETPMFVGRVITALASDPNILMKSGMAWAGFELAREYRLTDPLTDDNLLKGTGE
jgi:dehydrogenase/reductase SDR family member 1